MNASHRAGHRHRFYAVALSIFLLFAGGCSHSGPKDKVAPDGGSAGAANDSSKGAPKKPPIPTFKRPAHVRGIYLTGWSAGSKRKLAKMLALLDRTEINTLVIDVRDLGFLYWKNDIPLVKEAGALKKAVSKPLALMTQLSKRGVYPIARIACFLDGPLAEKYPERAVTDAKTGAVWRDRAKHRWLDPYNKANWEYLASIVDFALDVGFPEIQLDYVRFPSEGKASTMAFPAKKTYGDPKATSTEVIAAFGKFMADRVHARGAIIGADIFGVISVKKSDQGIGQELEKVAEPFDLISPMVYPSHFSSGMYNLKNPDANPYTIVLKSLKDYAKRLPNKPIRPWLQDFSLGMKYGKKEVQSQIKAARTVGYSEYMLWNAGNHYTEAAVTDTSHLLDKKKRGP